MTDKRSTTKIGILFVSLYVLICSIREIYFSSLLHSINLAVLLFLTFGISTFFFLILQTGKLKLLLLKARANHTDLIKINITTALMWGSFLFALKWIQPAIVASINGGMGPIVTLFLSINLLKHQKIYQSDFIAAIGVLGFVGFMATSLLLKGLPGTTGGHFGAYLGICGAVCSGVITALNNVYTKKLTKNGFDAREIMALRFFVLLLCSFCFGLFDYQGLSFQSLPIAPILVVAFFGMIVPLYFLQLGIIYSDVNIVSLLIALGPILTFIFQHKLSNIEMSIHALIGVLGVTSSVCLGIWFRIYKDKNMNKN